MGELEILLAAAREIAEKMPVASLVAVIVVLIFRSYREISRNPAGAERSANVVPLAVNPPCQCANLRAEIDQLTAAVNGHHREQMGELRRANEGIAIMLGKRVG